METSSELEQLEQKVAAMDGKVTKILHLLGGTELDTESGLVHRVKEQEKTIGELTKRVEKLEKWRDRIVWIFIGMSFPAGVGAWELLKNFLFKN